MISKTLLMLVGCLLTGLLLAPQDKTEDSIRVTASVDRDTIQIADPFDLKVEVVAPVKVSVGFPEFGDRIGMFDILETQDDQAESTNENLASTTFTRVYSLETLDSGTLEIPGIEVSVKEVGGDSRLLRTEPVKINVASLVEANADLTKFNDIAALIDVEEPQSPPSNVTWVTVAAGFALIAAAGCLALAMRSPAYASASEWALGRLDEAGGDFTRIEGILRGFLEERFEFPAPSFGATALTAALAERSVDKEAIAKIDEIVATSEKVKFGGVSISEAQSGRFFEQARELISSLSSEEKA